MKHYKSNGKLLLTGEYLVLDGAKALAIPTKYGQELIIEETETEGIHWTSYDEHKQIWFSGQFMCNESDFIVNNTSDATISERLIQIFNAARQLNPDFLKTDQGYTITSHLDFNRQWGLGSSSTLVNNISEWAKVDPYELLRLTFGGSGYDIACARHHTPILYVLNENKREVTPVNFSPAFSDHLYFVYLNKKQNSREGIKAYRSNTDSKTAAIDGINAITNAILSCESLEAFNALIENHERIISSIINIEPVKDSYFKDFDGSIKSLGAWGGDFILVSSSTDPTSYFKHRGLNTIIPYTDMVL